jgi:hypothetical protein
MIGRPHADCFGRSAQVRIHLGRTGLCPVQGDGKGFPRRGLFETVLPKESLGRTGLRPVHGARIGPLIQPEMRPCKKGSRLASHSVCEANFLHPTFVPANRDFGGQARHPSIPLRGIQTSEQAQETADAPPNDGGVNRNLKNSQRFHHSSDTYSSCRFVP